MSMLFPKWYLDKRRTGEVIAIGTRDYVCAGLFASLYVLWRANGRTFAKAILVNVAFVAVAAVSILAASTLQGAYAAIVTVAVLLFLGIAQSRMMVRYVVDYYVERGWERTAS